MMNPATILINLTIIAMGMSSEDCSQQPKIQMKQQSDPVVIPMVKMEGYERYLNDPSFDLTIQRIA